MKELKRLVCVLTILVVALAVFAIVHGFGRPTLIYMLACACVCSFAFGFSVGID